MAIKIKATPILEGDEAINFLETITKNEKIKTSKEEIEKKVDCLFKVAGGGI
jgi:hypothetical protein